MSCPSMPSSNSFQKESAIMVNQLTLVKLTLQPTMALLFLNLVPLTLTSTWQGTKPSQT